MYPDFIREALLRFQELVDTDGGTASVHSRQRQGISDRDLARLALKKYQKTQGWQHQRDKTGSDGSGKIGALLATLRS
jgi:hypothetical protein